MGGMTRQMAGSLAVLGMCAGAVCAPPAAERDNWWGDIPGFMDRQRHLALESAAETLNRVPPAPGEIPERRTALLLLDTLLHEPDAPEQPAVQAFFRDRTRAVADALKGGPVTEGARIWRLYNHGFIVRTAEATLAFDVVTGAHLEKEGFRLPEDVVADLARECDILFISHLHDDHADPAVAEAFVRAGKPVVVPGKLWDDAPFAAGLTRPARDAGAAMPLPVRDGAVRLEVVTFPGHQGKALQNNVVLVTTPGGLAFAHTGDQSNDDDFAWIDKVGDSRRVDVLLPNCWSPDLPRVVAGFRPAVVIPGHENELGHTLDHREPYWMTYPRLGDALPGAVLMAWGECYSYLPKDR